MIIFKITEKQNYSKAEVKTSAFIFLLYSSNSVSLFRGNHYEEDVIVQPLSLYNIIIFQTCEVIWCSKNHTFNCFNSLPLIMPALVENKNHIFFIHFSNSKKMIFVILLTLPTLTLIFIQFSS